MSDQTYFVRVTLGLSYPFFICEMRWADQMSAKMYTLLTERCFLPKREERGWTNLPYGHIL